MLNTVWICASVQVFYWQSSELPYVLNQEGVPTIPRERFKKKNWRDLAVPESVQSCFELSIHLSVFFSRELFLVAVHGWFAYRQMYGKFKT